MITSTISNVSTGEKLITLDVDGKRHGIIVIDAGNLSDYEANRIHKDVIMQGNTYGNKGAIEMFDYYKSDVRMKRQLNKQGV